MKELVRELRSEKVGRGTPGILPYHVARMLHLFLLEYPAGLKLLLETFTSGEAFFAGNPANGAQDQEAIMCNVGDGSLLDKVEPELELLTQV